jgi:hypothetical protein
MLVFDAVIYNEDRHFGNFGILRDNRTGEILAPAPLFDHGISLFNYALGGDLTDLEKYAATRAPAYNSLTFEGICAEVMGKAQMKQLRGLIGFRFKRHPAANWPEERLNAVERHTQKRVQQLLSLKRKI